MDLEIRKSKIISVHIKKRSPIFLFRNIKNKIIEHTLQKNDQQFFKQILLHQMVVFKYSDKKSVYESIQPDQNNQYCCFFCYNSRQKNQNPYKTQSLKFLLIHIVQLHANFTIKAQIDESTNLLIFNGRFNQSFYVKDRSQIKKFCDYSTKSIEKWEFFTNKQKIKIFLTKNFLSTLNNIFNKIVTKKQIKNDFKEDNDYKFINAENYVPIPRDIIKEKLKQRSFHHSNNIFELIGSDSLFEESELEIDDTALKEIEERAIDDFEDVDEKDKLLFKMWNYFVRENRRLYYQECLESGKIISYNKKNYKKYLNEVLGLQKFVMLLATFEIYDKIQSSDIVTLLQKFDHYKNL